MQDQHVRSQSSTESIGEVSRREFLKVLTAGGASLACGSALATFIVACGGSSDNATQPPPQTGAQEQITLASAPQLQNVGGFLRRSFAGRNNGREVLIVRVAQSGNDAFRTASVVCTHQGCNVENPQGASVTCLCHGSRFSLAASNFGAVQNGPAASPLPTFPTSFDGTTITITF